MRKNIADLDAEKEAKTMKVGSRKCKSPTSESEEECDDEEDFEDLEDEPPPKRRFVFQGVVI